MTPRDRLLRMHADSNVGHLGGNLSCLDILLALYGRVLTPDDSFVLSKGHSAGALYVTLWSQGLLSDDDLQTFHKDGGLPGHPSAGPHVPFATGSLGHGLSLSAGLALQRKLTGTPGRVYCLTSDGEWNEGSCWEALAFIRHHRLAVSVLVDANGLQGLGRTEDVLSLSPLGEKFRSFGYSVSWCDGHDAGSVAEALGHSQAVICRTVKGRGTPLEGRTESHYLPPGHSCATPSAGHFSTTSAIPVSSSSPGTSGSVPLSR